MSIPKSKSLITTKSHRPQAPSRHPASSCPHTRHTCARCSQLALWQHGRCNLGTMYEHEIGSSHFVLYDIAWDCVRGGVLVDVLGVWCCEVVTETEVASWDHDHLDILTSENYIVCDPSCDRLRIIFLQSGTRISRRGGGA
jgi:hypothetical protein